MKVILPKTSDLKVKISTRERILHAAEQTLLHSHVHALRYSHIAKLARVPQPLMGYHFPTLEILLLELTHRQLEKLKSLSLRNLEPFADEPLKALEAYIRTPFELAERDPVFRGVWTSFYHLASLRVEFADLNRSIRTTGRERILNLIVIASETSKNLQRPIVKLTDVAMCIQGVITGYCVMASSETGGDFKRMADLAVATTRTLLGLPAH